MSKTNLCIVGLSKEFTDNVCRKLASKMDMFYADIEKIFSYELVDMVRIEQVCGIEYLQKEQKSIVNRVCSYENTLINLQYYLLNQELILNIVKEQCLIIYLSLNHERYQLIENLKNANPSEQLINDELFEHRDFLCNTVSDITINCENLNEDELCVEIIDEILKYYN